MFLTPSNGYYRIGLHGLGYYNGLVARFWSWEVAIVKIMDDIVVAEEKYSVKGE